jgi:hypothetical protein
MYFYALPTYPQARRVAWLPLKALVPRQWVRKINESELTIETVFGSTLIVVGADKPQRLEGVQWDGGVVDESCDQKPGFFDLTLLPTFSWRDAWCWRIGVPKRYGKGAREFRRVCERWADPGDPATASFNWPSADILTPEMLEWAMENLDPRDFNEQYGANWEEAAGKVFHAFSNDNVSTRAVYRPDRPIAVGSDFNVNPMCWVLGHRGDNGFTWFDELFLRNTNTQATLDALHKRYSKHEAGFEFFGDATGQARKTSAAESDYLQIRSDDRFLGRRVFYPRKNPRVVNRFAACNALFRNAKGERRCFVHPRCVNLIRDLEDRQYKEGTREADDFGDIGHMTDAMGYPVHRCFPIRYKRSEGAPGVFIT